MVVKTVANNLQCSYHLIIIYVCKHSARRGCVWA